MRHRARHLTLALTLTVFASGCAPERPEPTLSQREVEAFVQSSEADLRNRNREGVIARYDSADDSAMVVAGQFRWHDRSSADTMQFSYVSLVRRTPSGLRISLEDESFAPLAPEG